MIQSNSYKKKICEKDARKTVTAWKDNIAMEKEILARKIISFVRIYYKPMCKISFDQNIDTYSDISSNILFTLN